MSKCITVGLDLGDSFSFFCMLDEAGEIVSEGKVRTGEAALARWLKGLPPAVVAMEVCVFSPWVSRLVTRLGHEAVVANASRVALIYQHRRKGDRVDAVTLARLARSDRNLLAPVVHRGEKTQRDLQVLRSRDALVAARTQLVNHVRSSAKAQGLRLPKCSAASFHNKVAALLPEELAGVLGVMLQMIGELTEKIRLLERQIEALCREYGVTELLRMVPGVGPITALAYVLTIEHPERFRRSRDVGAYLGLIPRRDQSGECDKQLRITKTGDAFLRRLLVGCAQYILGPFGPDTALRRWGLARLDRGGKNQKKRTIVAVARKLAVLLHRLWTTGEVYEPFPHGLPEECAMTV